jgi:hypothetical protein
VTVPIVPGNAIHLRVVSTADSKGLKDSAKDLKSLKGESDSLGKSFDRTEDEAFDLTAALEKQRRVVADLRQEFARTGDTGLLRDIRAQRGLQTQLERVRRDIDVDLPRLPRVTSSTIDAPDVGDPRARAALIGALVGAAVLAAPTVGAIVAGAVAGAIGTVGVAGGVAMVAKDARVKAAFAEFTKGVGVEFFRDTEVFIGPTVRSMKMLGDAFRDMKVPEAFSKMAPHIETIAEGLADMARNIMPGLNKAFDRMGPFTEIASEGLSDLGVALGYFLDDVTSSEGTLLGLKAFFDLLGGTVQFLGAALNVLSDAYEAWVRVQIVAGETMRAFGIGLGPVGEGFRKLGGLIAGVNRENLVGVTTWDAVGSAARMMQDSFDPFPRFLAEARDNAHALNLELDELFGAGMSAAEAADAYEAALDDLTDSLRENGRTIDANTEKGRENRAAFRDAIASAQESRDANVKNGMAVDAANRLYMQQVAAIEAIAAKARVTKTELEKLAGDYAISVHAAYSYTGSIGPAGSLGRSVKFQQFAAGGTTPADEPFWAGERGPELVFPTGKPQFVMSGRDSARHVMAATGGGTTTLALSSDGSRLADLLMETIAAAVRKHGGRASVLGIRSLS